MSEPSSNHRGILGVNIDHVATIRQVRGTAYPCLLEAARAAQAGGADHITIHLREDRRHIVDADVPRLIDNLAIGVNLEIAVSDEMIAIARAHRPAYVCFVPERRLELTTENGLDVASHRERIRAGIEQMRECAIRTCLFVDPDDAQLTAAADVGADAVEIHTGGYAENLDSQVIRQAAQTAHGLGLSVHAGHGLTAENVGAIAAIEEISELNIGHSLVARALFVGLEHAVREMTDAMRGAWR